MDLTPPPSLPERPVEASLATAPTNAKASTTLMAPVRLDAATHARLQTWFLGIIAFALTLFLLVQARFILTTLVFAIILFTMTTGAINSIAKVRIGHWRVTNFVASLLAFALIALALLTLSAIVVTQINTIVQTATTYADQGIGAIARLFAPFGEEVVATVERSMRSVPLSGFFRTAAEQAGNIVSASTLVILFVGFLFAERIWFEPKLTNLIGDPARAAKVERIITSIINRVNHYLLVKTGISAATAAAVYFICMAFRLEFAMGLALLTFILNYLPSIGSVVATLAVALVAFLQLNDPSTALLILVIVTLMQFLLGNVVDPMLMGKALRVSSFAIMIAMAFWGAVWGVAGMFLSVPILVAMMIICSHIPVARPIAVLISREGLPEETFED